MNADEAAERFATLFPEIFRRFHRRIGSRSYRPTPESLAVLRHLADAGPLTVTEAARHMRRSQAAMSELLNRLERRGLLARLRDDRDRRRTLVWLTKEGRRALRQAGAVLSPRLLQHAFAQLPSDKRMALLAAVEALLETKKAQGVQDE